jgi:hypothetical protein
MSSSSTTVLDPPGHVRLPINGDELVDRTVAFQALAGPKITMISYDTGQSTRARAAGLRPVKIQQPRESDEPERDNAGRTAGPTRMAR